MLTLPLLGARASSPASRVGGSGKMRPERFSCHFDG